MATPATETRNAGSRRPVLIAIGLLAALIGVAALIGAGILVAAHATERDGDGFYSSDAHALSTPTHALVILGEPLV